MKRLFEAEVAEVRDGTVEIKSIAREAGSRTKMAVWSNDPNVDPVGACVGMNGARVNAVVQELRGEKMQSEKKGKMHVLLQDLQDIRLILRARHRR